MFRVLLAFCTIQSTMLQLLPIVVAGVLTLQSGGTKPPKDFEVYLEVSSCVSDVIDTARDLYTRNFGPGTESVRVRLSDSERASLFDAVSDAKFLELPARIGPKAGDGRALEPDGTLPTTSTFISGAPTYQMKVSSAGKQHEVVMVDHNSMHELHIRFRELVRRAFAIYRERPEVKRLPAHQFLCL